MAELARVEHTPAPVTEQRRAAATHSPDTLRRQMGAQASLTVGPAGDAYEREADQIAHQVVTRLQSAAPADADGAAQRTVQRATTRIHRRAEVGAEGGRLDGETEQMLHSARSGGQPLDAQVRRTMEAGIGADFGSVRVHQGQEAAELSSRIQASAFTVGSDIFVRRSLDTSSTAGQELLAHELVHVVQQGAAPATVRRSPEAPAAEAPAPEAEAAETEGTEAEIATEGTIPDTVPEEDPVLSKGPDDRAQPTRRLDHSSVPGGRNPVRLQFGMQGVNAASVNGTGGGKYDTVTSGATVKWSGPGGKKVDPFGEESFSASYGGVKWTQESATSPIKIDFKLNAKCAWGAKSDGQKDVTSGTSSLVKADTYQDIISDLTPELKEKSWRAPRSNYWSKAICERHEKFHSTDDKQWVEGAGKNHMLAFLDNQTIDLTDKERKSKSAVGKKVKGVLDQGIEDLQNANFDFYTGGAGSYLSYAGEERAFGDGKQPYLDLVAAVKTQGEKLVEDQKKKEEAKAKKSAPKVAKDSGTDTTTQPPNAVK